MNILSARANRKELLALTPKEREAILRQQAEAMETFYQKDSEWRELEQIDDFYEYDQ